MGELQPVSDWRRVLRRAWSIRWLAAAGVFSAAEVALPILHPVIRWLPDGTFAMVAGLCTGAAFVSRLVAQKNMKDGA